ncbi:MAG: hypothetical protein FJW86_12810 [Actinobacteria bacterium]|nr:hypothetical protein [Actinomycetota bacterium]
MDERLLTTVASRLDASDLDDETGLLVLAACEGDDALTEAIGGRQPQLTDPAPHDAELPEPAGAYLASIGVEGFRGVGEARTLPLTAGPGLTLVVGRNGSGKSSFVEALEVLLTGDSRRWASRQKSWREGWRNLHHPDPSSVRATFSIDRSAGLTSLVREWKTGADLDDAITTAQAHGKPKGALEDLAWSDALVAYRPILSYNELGSILDEGPAHLYDALVRILGVDEVTDAFARLRSARLQLDNRIDAVKEEAKVLVRTFEDIDDERAERCRSAMSTTKWNLEGIASVVTGTGEVAGSSIDLDLLRGFTQLTGPDPEMVRTALERARAAVAERAALVGTDAEGAARLAELLEQALAHHEHAGDEACPVCGQGQLDKAWAEQTEAEVERLNRIAHAVRHAVESERSARQRLESLQKLPSTSLPEATRLELDAEGARRGWEQWLGVDTSDLGGAADSFERLFPALTAGIEALRTSAAAAFAERQDVWQPVAEEVAAWLERARAAEPARLALPRVTKAEGWLRGVADELRDERLAPIARQAAAIWKQLSQHSNVALGPIKLKGTGPKRRVDLDVTVDGVDSVALSVMSQGELHALALAIFLPRATRADSPFRFLVIDDPVQAMDPAKVEGLSRVLEDTAKTRQVVVFTHDDRLPEAVRRLGIDAKVLQVTRSDGSAVEIREVGSPSSVYIDDARSIVLTNDLPDEVKRRVVPGYCRHALEAVLNEISRRKLFAAGAGHDEVEERLVGVTTLTTRAALALFGDEDRGGEVMSRLNTFGGWAGDVFKACNKGSHDAYAGDLKGFVRDAEKLVEKLSSTQ